MKLSENFSDGNTKVESTEETVSDEISYEQQTSEMTAEVAQKTEKLSTISAEKEFKDDEDFIETNLDYAEELDNPDELIESQEQFGLTEETTAKAESFDMSPQPKKYVVAVTPDNIPFFDKYDPEERADLVNELLMFRQEEIRQQDRNYRVKKLSKHLLIAALTTFIALPLMFTFINKSIEATLNSYQEVQNNFEKLYIQKGGLKKKDMSKLRGLEY